MPKQLEPGACHQGRSPGIRVLNVSIDREAFELLQELAPTRKGHGAYVSRLIHMEHARRQERQRILQVVADE